MPLKSSCGSLKRHGGFSLIEAVVATAILLMASAGVTGAVTASLQGASTEAAQRRLEQDVRAELARLAALPFDAVVAAPPAHGYDPAAARSLLQAVFPHAQAARNTQVASYAAASATTAATFTTTVPGSEGDLRVSATFVEEAEGVWVDASPEAHDAWAVWLDALPPATALRVTVQASAGAHHAAATTVLSADRPQAGT
jgi:hypothetical protein